MVVAGPRQRRKRVMVLLCTSYFVASFARTFFFFFSPKHPVEASDMLVTLAELCTHNTRSLRRRYEEIRVTFPAARARQLVALEAYRVRPPRTSSHPPASFDFFYHVQLNYGVQNFTCLFIISRFQHPSPP